LSVVKGGTDTTLVNVEIVAPSTVITTVVFKVTTPPIIVSFVLNEVPVWPPPIERNVVANGGHEIVVGEGRRKGGSIRVQGGMHWTRGSLFTQVS
jgi:hypothetical protein